MSELETVRLVTAIMAKCGLGYFDCASIAHISPATMRVVLLTSKLPKRAQARRAIEKFVDLNRQARSRSDLRLVDIA